MTCKTCKREEFPEDCGPRGTEPCPCCGMQIIATADTFEPQTPEEDNHPTEES